MMRVVENKMRRAMRDRRDLRCGNTKVLCFDNAIRVYLHGNMIAELSKDGLYVSDCGWQTATTKSRLNAILGLFHKGSINQHKYRWYRNGEKWNGSAVFEDIHL